jgi:hypothetical protein
MVFDAGFEMSAFWLSSTERSLSTADSDKVTWQLTAELFGDFLTPLGVTWEPFSKGSSGSCAKSSSSA